MFYEKLVTMDLGFDFRSCLSDCCMEKLVECLTEEGALAAFVVVDCFVSSVREREREREREVESD